MRWIAVLIVVAVLASGCTNQIDNGNTTVLSDVNFQMSAPYWGFDDECLHGNASVAYVDLSCRSGVECEVYVNGARSNYGLDGLQACGGGVVIAESELSQKPDFVAQQNGDKYYYTRRDRNKIIEICCSYTDDSHKLLRDYEECQSTRLDAQCPEQAAKGFGQLVPFSWTLHYDGTLEIKVVNDGQDAVMTKMYLGNFSTMYSTQIASKNLSATLTIANGPRGRIGDNYAVDLSIEYLLTTNATEFLNSTGIITGMYY